VELVEALGVAAVSDCRVEAVAAQSDAECGDAEAVHCGVVEREGRHGGGGWDIASAVSCGDDSAAKGGNNGEEEGTRHVEREKKEKPRNPKWASKSESSGDDGERIEWCTVVSSGGRKVSPYCCALEWYYLLAPVLLWWAERVRLDSSVQCGGATER